jgi:nitrilase
MRSWRRFRAAAVQAAPIFLNPAATISKAAGLAREAAECGARLIVFPEVFVAGYPYWNWIYHPLRGSEWFARLYHSAIEVGGPEVTQLCDLARALQVHIVIGINERDSKSLGTIFNTNLLISPSEGVVNRQRKLVPTFAEKLSWASGDATGLRVTNTPLGPIGMLACGENTNTLARFALLAEGELIHVANFIAFPFIHDYDMPAAIRLRCGAHAFEGKVFCIVACSAMSEDIVKMLATSDEERRLLTGAPNAYSAIFGPNGQIIGEPIIDAEGIIYADIDLEECLRPKQFHDITGHYNRPDIFTLSIDRNPQSLLQPVPPAGQRPADAPTYPAEPLRDAAEYSCN